MNNNYFSYLYIFLNMLGFQSRSLSIFSNFQIVANVLIILI
ncbi:hypothetical protein BGAPBR_Q0024 (plasmid) [Borreliella garinii PBr]|uniref:Uncharacterized protein n=1 Tax=Borreliella garinii PBr TaxID=498743 RepID=B8F1A1_BORGR|nr:hypothetical protein BGAPBR_Q0024 [Borreliella garinii PBr]